MDANSHEAGGIFEVRLYSRFDAIKARAAHAGPLSLRLMIRTAEEQTALTKVLVSCPRNKHIFRCDQNGPPARRSEPDWQWEGAYLDLFSSLL